MPKATDQNEWAIKAKNNLKGALKTKGLGYKQLAEKLTEMGLEISEQGLNNKISRGGFSAAFYLQCLDAIESREVGY